MKKNNGNSGTDGNYDSHYNLSKPIARKHIWAVVIGIYAVLIVIIGYLEIRDGTIYKAIKHKNHIVVENRE